MERIKHLQARAELRSAAHGTGDRSDKIRTYNFPQVTNVAIESISYCCNFFCQDRVTDHRVSVTVNSVERVLNGEMLNTIIDALVESDEQERIDKFLENSLKEKD